jgi:hypothetical protein
VSLSTPIWVAINISGIGWTTKALFAYVSGGFLDFSGS